ncbi:MAG: hypothetical protein OK438_01095 [Thaumarchaeota archaeon]|nr:hypothetical protein [Nitrososphaerota archaeon]
MRRKVGKIRFYHRTTVETARMILREGFRDDEGSYLTERTFRGVWVSDRPLDSNEGTKEGALMVLDVDLPPRQLAKWEWVEEGKTYREWLIPASVLNQHSRVRLDPDG